jgi:hypothetical protein
MHAGDDYETPDTKTMVVTLSALIDYADNGQDIETQIKNEIDMMDLRLGGEYRLELEEVVEIYKEDN